MTAPVRHLTPQEFAEREGIGLTTERDWRRDGRSPKFIKEGGIVRYRLADVEEWERSHLVPSSAA